MVKLIAMVWLVFSTECYADNYLTKQEIQEENARNRLERFEEKWNEEITRKREQSQMKLQTEVDKIIDDANEFIEHGKR